MQFEILGYADISTSYLEETDLHLLATAPHHLAEIDGGVGTILWLSTDGSPLEEFVAEAKLHGLSDRFIDIIRELDRQKIRYVRFDADGGEVEGIEPMQDVD